MVKHSGHFAPGYVKAPEDLHLSSCRVQESMYLFLKQLARGHMQTVIAVGSPTPPKSNGVLGAIVNPEYR